MEIQTKTRRWGNSIAVIIPSNIVETRNIKENEDITVTILKNRPQAGALFGKFTNWKKSTQEMKDDMKRGWLSISDKEREEQWKKEENQKK
jgi:antitoxin component of MazEF toxin-antitoxin module